MPDPFPSLRDYSGAGVSSVQEVSELQKALSAGSDINAPATAPGVGFPLRRESLEATMKNATFELDEIKLFKTMPKIPASNTVEEFVRLLSYSEGGSRRFNQGFMDEGGLPDEEDSTYERAYMPVKFMGVTGRVTHVATIANTVPGNVIALETMNKAMHLMKNLENAVFFGNSALIPEQFDGLQKLITDGAPDNVIDLRGGTLTEGKLNDVMLRIRNNFGTATDAYFGTGAFADIATEMYDRLRFPAMGVPGVLGAQVNAFQGQHGKLNLHDHVFLTEGQGVLANGMGKANKKPLAPSIIVAPANAPNAASQFVTADAGTYFYQVVAGNKSGLSAPVVSAAVTVAAGDAVTFTIQDNGQSPSFYEIYRSDSGGAASTAKLMTRVARTGATQVVTDLNDDIPGTSQGFVLMQNARSFSWAQLLPMTRIPLAAIDTSIRWSQVVYGGVKMYTPTKNVVIKNIGRRAGAL